MAGRTFLVVELPKGTGKPILGCVGSGGSPNGGILRLGNILQLACIETSLQMELACI